MIVIASGYFDPLHVGHLEYLRRCKAIAGESPLYVIVNNRKQALLKKGYEFMMEKDRLELVRSIAGVDHAMLSENDESTDVSWDLRYLAAAKRSIGPLLFCKGGDRSASEIPERETCLELGIAIVDGLGVKTRSSSDLLESWFEVRQARGE